MATAALFVPMKIMHPGWMLLFLVLMPYVGRSVNGAQRWLSLGPVNLQPSELMKIFAALYAADYTVRKQDYMHKLTLGFLAMALGMDPRFDFSDAYWLVAGIAGIDPEDASIGSAAVPGAGMVMLVIVMAQAGIPEAGLALIFAVDRPLDMFRTMVNVTSDSTVATIIAKGLGKLETPVMKA